MNTNVNLLAPIGALALLGTGFLLLMATLVLVQSLVVRHRGRTKFVFLIMLGIAAAYAVAILVFSLASHEKVLARGEEKHFCELDCHLAYSITTARQTTNIGNPTLAAKGVYIVVTIKTRFDEATISPGRGNGLLYPNSRVLTLVDERGNEYLPADDAQRLLEMSEAVKPMTTPLRPGESYNTAVVFDLPSDAKASTLLIHEGEWETHLLIGHENSPFHRQTRFQL
jgi:hypothetical protein